MQDIEFGPPSHGTQGSWRRQLAYAHRSSESLTRRLELPDTVRRSAEAGAETFPLVVPESYAERIVPGNPRDPLLLQVLPSVQETENDPDFVADPVGDCHAETTPGMLHKYEGRALLITTGVCAVHCRYCFRRHFPYADAPGGIEAWQPALREIERDPSIEEILLSGGDPLTRTDAWLAQLVSQLEAIPHVRRLRIHTRLPIVIPDRVTEELLGWMTGCRLPIVVVVHANHPQELSDDCVAALQRLKKSCSLLLNQSVLLRGVNDDARVLAELSKRLIDAGVQPYYLHQLDRVQGAQHFEVSVEKGLELMEELRRQLPGYAVPRYVQEIAGEPYKVELPHAATFCRDEA